MASIDPIAEFRVDHRQVRDSLLELTAALEIARSEVANLIGANPEEIIFTSCGSEANNLAIKGIAKAYIKKGKNIISTPLSIFRSCIL